MEGKKIEQDTIERLESENRAYERSNRLMEAELGRLRAEIALLEQIADDRAAEVYRLQHRSLWRRILNK